jgi:glycosyltransferase involved in cell wall biosynthesis
MAETFAQAGLNTRVITLHQSETVKQDQFQPGYVVKRYPQPAVGWQWRWREWVAARHWASLVRQQPDDGWLWATEPVAALGVVLAGRGDRLVYNPPWCAAMMQQVYRARPEAWTQKTRWLLRRIEAVVYSKARLVVTASENLRQQYFETLGPREGVHVVHHGVDMPNIEDEQGSALRASLGISPRTFLVGSVSRIDPMKDYAFLIRAMAELRDCDAKLIIAGQGPEMPALERLANDLAIADKVHLLGNLPDPLPAYEAMDVMVLPSVYEPFGNVVREAMAAGRAVIGRRRDADPARPVLVANDELIDHGRTGLLVDPHDPSDLAQQLSRLARQPELAREMGRQARHAMAQQGWEVAIEQYLRLLGISDATGDGARRLAA